MDKLVVIIPVHEYNSDVDTLLGRAIKSVPNDIEVRLSCKHGLSEELKSFQENPKVVIYESEDENSKSDFATLVNQAVGNSEYFSILEYDDEYSEIWYNNFIKYSSKKPEVSVFMYLEDLIDFNNDKFINFGNEAPWASSFSEEIGYIDEACLKDFFDFYLTGSIFNTTDWENIGGLKSSIKLSFWYEFVLRLTYNGKKIYVIPKVGYKHYINRPNSLYLEYANTMTEKESNGWYEIAQQEYFFKQDRNKVYNKNEEE